MRQKRQECGTSAARTTRMKNFNFDHDTSENTFLQPYIRYITNERLQGEEEQFHFKNYLLEMSRSHAKMHLNVAPQKLDFVMTKTLTKSYIVDSSCKCPCTFPHSCA